MVLKGLLKPWVFEMTPTAGVLNDQPVNELNILIKVSTTRIDSYISLLKDSMIHDFHDVNLRPFLWNKKMFYEKISDCMATEWFIFEASVHNLASM